MFSLGTQSKTILPAFTATLLFATVGAAQIYGPLQYGQTPATSAGSTGVPAAAKLEWIKPSLVGLPPARCCPAMVYDRAMGATLLFGGRTYSTTYADTWAFSKSTGWTELTPAVSPPPVTGPSLAYDPTTETVVLFGGGLSSGPYLNETWTWDGVTWTQQFPPVSPPARNWNATNGMVFDYHLGKVVMFGGGGTTVANYNDTWEWDGKNKTWTQQFPAHSPSPRTATLAYDEATNQVVFIWGNTNGIDYGDTWTYMAWIGSNTSR